MDSALKQRLLGAAVLVALAVIFVPMFLGNNPQPDKVTQSLDIPAPPERKFATRTMPVDATPSTPAAVPAKPDSTGGDHVVTVDTKAPPTFEAPDAAPAAKPTVSAPKPAAAAPAVAPATPTTAPVAAPANATSDGRFSVNLGVYTDPAHADALVAKVKKLGFAAYTEATDYQGKAAQRVRVGPFAERAAAESARLKIKQSDPKLPNSISESGEQPKSDAPATAVAPTRAGGWSVQVGAFKSETDANKVRDRLRGGSFAAFVDRTGSGEQAMWRVRAGPYAERVGAETARSGIKQKLQLDGVVVTQP